MKDYSELNLEGETSFESNKQERTSLADFMNQKFEIKIEIVTYRVVSIVC